MERGAGWGGAIWEDCFVCAVVLGVGFSADPVHYHSLFIAIGTYSVGLPGAAAVLLQGRRLQH